MGNFILTTQKYLKRVCLSKQIFVYPSGGNVQKFTHSTWENCTNYYVNGKLLAKCRMKQGWDEKRRNDSNIDQIKAQMKKYQQVFCTGDAGNQSKEVSIQVLSEIFKTWKDFHLGKKKTLKLVDAIFDFQIKIVWRGLAMKVNIFPKNRRIKITFKIS